MQHPSAFWSETLANTTFCPHFSAIPRLLKCLKVKRWLQIFHWSRTILFRLAKTDSVQQNVLLWFDLWHSTNSYISHPCPSLQVVEVLEEIGDGSRCCKFHNIIGISSSVGSCSKPSSHVLEQLLRCSDSCDTYCYLEAWKFLMYKLTWSSLLAAIVCWFETKMG